MIGDKKVFKGKKVEEIKELGLSHPCSGCVFNDVEGDRCKLMTNLDCAHNGSIYVEVTE